ncbi:MAG: NPCBM/NEW2 domain-containing protein [Planctomycetaceae bacterium]|nr:NPCBM/NEW2 domain-containing protein [Planctomycetaceae bacterium]
MSQSTARRAAEWTIIAACGWALVAGVGAGPAGAAERYAAWLANGRRISAPRLSAWHTPATLRLQGDDEKSQLRLIRDRQAKVQLKPPYLLLANGDVLTGSPVQLEPDLGRQGIMPRVRVQLEGMLPVSGTGVAIRTDRIARIVGSAEASLRQEPPPGTVQLADGRRLIGRSIKWREYGLAVLTSDGIVEANYPDIVDAVFLVDQTAAVLDDNLVAASASGGGSAAIVRFQLTSGATITASLISREQERSRRSRRSGVELTTYYYAQPAWADHPLALPEKDVAWCGYREADEAPLALLPAKLVASQRLVGGGPIWQRSAAGGALGSDASAGGLPASGSWETDLGLATHSHSELEFELPPGAKQLHTTVGMDRAVGAGGCVRCRIAADEPRGQTLWDSGILLGSAEPKSTGPIDVTGHRRVVLITEFAHDDRPPAADPLDIRDQVVWLAPIVELDLDRSEHLPAALVSAADWQVSGVDVEKAQIAARWNEFASAWDPLLVLPRGTQLTFTRRLAVTRTSDIVELLTACPLELDEHEFELLCISGGGLRADGKRVASQLSLTPEIQRQWLRFRGRPSSRDEIDKSYLTDRLAYWWDLSEWRGQVVTLELVIRGRRERNEITWRGLSIRSAIANLPAIGEPLPSDVPLTSLTPLSATSGRARVLPLRNGLPGDRGGDRFAQPIRFLGQAYYGGYGMAYSSSISFELAPEYRRFVAVAGCPLFVAGPMQVLIDGKVAWERPLMHGMDPAEQIDIPIPAGAKTLTLQTGPESSYTGLAAFAEAGFVTKP